MAPIKLKDEGFTSSFLAPMIPFQDVTKFFEGIGGAALGQKSWGSGVSETASDVLANISPLLGTPFELATGKTLFGQRPIKGLPQYILNKLPQTRFAVDPSTNLKDRLINELGGLGYHTVGPQSKTGELKRMDTPLQALLHALNQEQASKAQKTYQEFTASKQPVNNIPQWIKQFETQTKKSPYETWLQKYLNAQGRGGLT